MRKSFVIVFAMLFVLGLAAPAFADGPADKATGSGYWTNRGDVDYYGEFNAHESKDGRPAQGRLLQARADWSGGFVVDVTQVWVGTHPNPAFGDYACFMGPVVSSWGNEALGLYRYTFIRDGGEPGVDADRFQGFWTNDPNGVTNACKEGRVGNPHWLTGGNFQVHLSR